jgi:two-component system, cell cycle response regulator
VISVPVNPARLLRALDQYTIKELNFFPEFQIGSDSTDLSETTIAGLKLLKGESGPGNKRQGLQRALVVDDSLAVRKQIEIEFGLLETEVDSVDSAEAAIEASAKTAYDIIFMDVVMPGMDGYGACKRIKRSPLNKNTPIVLLTSRSSSFDKIKGTLAGCDTYLVKPINHNEFENVVNKYFSEIRTLAK